MRVVFIVYRVQYRQYRQPRHPRLVRLALRPRPFSADRITHTVTLSIISLNIDGKLELVNGSDPYTGFGASQSGVDVYIDNVAPSSMGNIVSTSDTTSTITFTEPVIGLVSKTTLVLSLR